MDLTKINECYKLAKEKKELGLDTKQPIEDVKPGKNGSDFDLIFKEPYQTIPETINKPIIDEQKESPSKMMEESSIAFLKERGYTITKTTEY